MPRKPSVRPAIVERAAPAEGVDLPAERLAFFAQIGAELLQQDAAAAPAHHGTTPAPPSVATPARERQPAASAKARG